LQGAVHAVVAPWNVPLTDAEHSLALYGIVVAAFALGAGLLRMWATRGDVSPRYRPAALAGTGVAAVAFTSYAVIALLFLLGYDRTGGSWRPNDAAMSGWSVRFMDWSVSVPLLVVELIAVSALTGRLARRLRAVGVAAAFLMILLGYVGGVVVDGGTNVAALATWGGISSVFFAVLYIVVIVTVVRSLPDLPPSARKPYRSAMLLLLVVWFVYPIVFGLQGQVWGGQWTMVETLAFCAADVVAKVGYGVLLHRVARIRTASDVVRGTDTHPESIWLEQVKLADGVTPPARAGD
jgi:bacteriorhodopsin